LEYMFDIYNNVDIYNWTFRFSHQYKSYLVKHKVWATQKKLKKKLRTGSTRTTILTYLKAFANYIHSNRPFPPGNPMKRIQLGSSGQKLDTGRAISESDRTTILNAADAYLTLGGKSKDRRRYGHLKIEDKPKVPGARVYRDRAIIYTLVETGMRRMEVTEIRINKVKFKVREITVLTKGSSEKTKVISKAGIQAIKDYVDNERDLDNEHFDSDYLFLNYWKNNSAKEKLSPTAINIIWNRVLASTTIEGKTPHSARHGMAFRILNSKKGNVSAVKDMLDHQNEIYALTYLKVTKNEMKNILDELDEDEQ